MKNGVSQRNCFRVLKTAAMTFYLTVMIVFTVIPHAEARRGGRDPVQPGKNNCRLAKGSIKMPGYPVYDSNDPLTRVQVATKRVTVLWRYVDANCDGVMTWGGVAVDGADYLRIVPRTQYTFLLDYRPPQDINGVTQITTHHFGPSVSGSTIATSFRVIAHDDLIPGLPAPGDLTFQLFDQGPPVPGLTASVRMFTASGDVWQVPASATQWGAVFRLTFLPATSTHPEYGLIPAGAIAFLDSQLNAYDIVPTGPINLATGQGHCEAGFWEEDFINGESQPGPNTANNTDPNVVPIPIMFADQCSNNTP